jgi:hypothetical protein
MERLALSDRRIADWLALLTFAVYAYFYAGGGWNQNAQFDLTRAIVERHTFAIDELARNTGDVSRYGGHVYSNKAPGLSWIGAVPYALIYAVESRAGISGGATHALTLNNYLCTLLCVIPFAAAVPALLYGAGRRRGYPASWSALVALSVAFATLMFPYASYFIVHAPSGGLLLMALVARRRWLGGVAAGLAAAMNYLCGPAVLLFALVRGRRQVWPFLLGAAPALILLALYQRICFGAFTTTSIGHMDERFVAKGAAFGILGRPSLEALYGITFSPYRGLFFFAPVLLMALVGAVLWWREPTDASRESRYELLAIVAVSAVFFAFNVSFNGWEGGFAVGARYLVPLIPLWGLALLRCRRGWQQGLFGVVAALSLVINFAAVAVDPQPSGTIPRPLTQYLLPLLIRGQFSSSVPITPPWSAATFTGHTSVNRVAHDEPAAFYFHPPGSPAAEWASFNLGEAFFGPGDARSLIPVLLLLFGGATVILLAARRLDRAG